MQILTKIHRKIGQLLRVKTFENKYYCSDFPLRQCLKSREITVFDVGANAGQSIERFYKNYNVKEYYAFEPQNVEFQNIKTKYSHYKGIKFYNNAFGEVEKEAKINRTLKSGTSTLNDYNTSSEYVKTKIKTHQVTHCEDLIIEKQPVQVMTLDNFIESNTIKKIDLLKIDTEGYESKILKGAQRTLATQSINCIEVELTFDDRFGKTGNFYDIEQYLVPNGFNLCGIDEPYSRPHRSIFHVNCVYIKDKIT